MSLLKSALTHTAQTACFSAPSCSLSLMPAAHIIFHRHHWERIHQISSHLKQNPVPQKDRDWVFNPSFGIFPLLVNLWLSKKQKEEENKKSRPILERRRKGKADTEKERCGVRVLGHGGTCVESETLPRPTDLTYHLIGMKN